MYLWGKKWANSNFPKTWLTTYTDGLHAAISRFVLGDAFLPIEDKTTTVTAFTEKPLLNPFK